MDWAHCHTPSQLNGCLNGIPPAEFKQTFYATEWTDHPLVGIQWPESPSNPR
jgi:putative transposase